MCPAYAQTDMARKPGLRPVHALWIILLAALAIHAWHLRLVNDDFFISLRYAENWLKGEGLVWNPGERVEGYTNFMYVVILAGVLKSGAEPVMAAQMLGFISACIALFLTARTYQRLNPQENPGPEMIAPAMLVSSGPYAAWSVAALETPIFLALVLAALLLFFKWLDEKKTWTIIAGGFLFTLSAMTRPEGLAFYAIALLWLQGTAWKREGRITLSIWPALMGLVIIYIPYFIWRYSYYGWLLPNSFYARMGTSISQDVMLWKKGISYIFLFLKTYPLLALLAIPVFMKRKDSVNARLALILILIFFWMAYLVAVGGDSKIYFRLMVPAMPFIAILCTENIRRAGYLAAGLIKKTGKEEKAGRDIAYFIAAVVCLSMLAPSLRGYDYKRLVHVREKANPQRVLAGKWLAENSGAGESIACMACGAIPYYSKLQSYDMFGVNDEHIAHSRLIPGRASAHAKMDRDYILGKKPTYIFDYSEFDYSTGGYEKKMMKFETRGGPVEVIYWKLVSDGEGLE
jgi:arabinofuranosyltransferase